AGDAIINVPEMIAIAEQRSRAHADELTQAAHALARRFQMDIESRRWFGTLNHAPSYLAKRARTFDHTFLIAAEGSLGQLEIAEAVVLGCGGPMWVLPGGEARGHLERVAIAWDGSRAAARALRDALPILRAGTHVIILSATDDKPMDDLQLPEVQQLLEEHDLETSTILFCRGNRPIGVALQEAAIEAGAGLLVMGAYGHNRLREFALGGATRSVLSAPRLPVLMSH
ncbi:MAG: universal stress protein, partial [Rhizobiaceae bacterium]